MNPVLVVDDDPRILRMLCSFLKAEGYEVRTADCGQPALELIAETPSLVLLDLNLPDIDGDEVFRRARSLGYFGPIVLISADLRAEQIARELGAGFLAKPFDPSDLFQLLEELTGPLQVKAS